MHNCIIINPIDLFCWIREVFLSETFSSQLRQFLILPDFLFQPDGYACLSCGFGFRMYYNQIITKMPSLSHMKLPLHKVYNPMKPLAQHWTLCRPSSNIQVIRWYDIHLEWTSAWWNKHSETCFLVFLQFLLSLRSIIFISGTCTGTGAFLFMAYQTEFPTL